MAAVATMGEFGRAAPFLVAVVGIALVYVGLRWSRWREAIRAATLARMPRWQLNATFAPLCSKWSA